LATQQLYQNILTRSKLTIALLFGILLLLAANVLLDYLYTLFRNSSFYISESLLFSSYWLLFLPFLPLVLRIVNETNRMEIKWLAVGAAIGVHTFLYPALVWIISRTFYGYTFDYWQTFNYGMSAYFIKTVIIYGFSMVSLTIWANKSRVRMAGATEVDRKKEFIRTILVADHNNKKLLLQVDDILYFSANSPYVGIYHSEKNICIRKPCGN
jgi:two-component system response regulator LytT